MNVPPAMPYSPRPKKPFFQRGVIRLLLIVALAGGGWYLFGHGAKSGPTGPAATNVVVATATKKQVPITLHAVGTVVAYESVAIRSRIDSQVVAVHFKDGDEVKKGDLLFELDDKSLRAQAAQLEANIARDRATLENARRQSSRADALVAKGFATKASVDDATANLGVAQASLSASIAALDNIKVLIGYTRITAPISGRTGTINVTLGNNVKANDSQALVTINQLKPIRVQAALPQNYFESVRSAMQAGTVTVRAMQQNDTKGEQGALAEGALDYIDNAVDQATSTFATRAGFPNEDERLVPGMFVTATMTLGSEASALTVPEVAVQHGQNGDYVFVIVSDKAIKRDIVVDRMQDDMAVIASGLEEGTQVAIDGMLGLKDGATVAIVQQKAPASAVAAKPAAESEPKLAPAAAPATENAAPVVAPIPAAPALAPPLLPTPAEEKK